MFRTARTATILLLAFVATAQAQATGHRVKVNGMQMYYEVTGNGDPLNVLTGRT